MKFTVATYCPSCDLLLSRAHTWTASHAPPTVSSTPQLCPRCGIIDAKILITRDDEEPAVD